MNQKEELTCEIQIRKILLDFYSSQLGGHSRLIIGFSAILLGLITVRDNLISTTSLLHFLIMYLSVFIASFFFCYLLMRYIMYGVLANSVTHTSIAIKDDSCSFSENRDKIRDEAIKAGMPLKLPLKWFLSTGPTPDFARWERIYGLFVCLGMGLLVTVFIFLLPLPPPT